MRKVAIDQSITKQKAELKASPIHFFARSSHSSWVSSNVEVQSDSVVVAIRGFSEIQLFSSKFA